MINKYDDIMIRMFFGFAVGNHNLQTKNIHAVAALACSGEWIREKNR